MERQDSELLANMSRYTQTSVKVMNASFTVLMLRVHAKWVNYYYWQDCMQIENINSCGVYTQHQDRERLKPHLHALKRSALHSKFLAPCRD